MKKIIISCLIALVGFSLTGCVVKNTEPTCYFHQKTIDLVCNADEWSFDNTLNMYYCRFTVDALTKDVYNYGEISINREYNSGTTNAYQIPLPETTYMVEQDGDNTFYYAQHVDYIYGVGYITIYFTMSDYFYPSNFTPGALVFRAQLTY